VATSPSADDYLRPRFILDHPHDKKPPPHSTSARRSRRALDAALRVLALALTLALAFADAQVLDAVEHAVLALTLTLALAFADAQVLDAVEHAVLALALTLALAFADAQVLDAVEHADLLGQLLGRLVSPDAREFGVSGRHKSHEDGEADGGGGKGSLHYKNQTC
jgi:hypothetical protein